MTIQLQLDEPLLVNTETGDVAESVEILAIYDDSSVQTLSVKVQLWPYPGQYETLNICQHDDYEALGDWTYAEIGEMVKTHLATLWAPAPTPVEEPAPEGESAPEEE